jgi:hypothetical protein
MKVLAAMQTSIVGKRSVNAQQLTGIDAIKSVEIDCVNATISCYLQTALNFETWKKKMVALF